MMLVACSQSTTVGPHSVGQSEASRLIEELASNYKPLHPNGYHGEAMYGVFGADDEKPDARRIEDAKRVRAAYESLQAMGMAAFPALISACNDERYSFSGVYAAWRNHTVGDACRMIIEGQVDFYGYGYKSRDCPTGGHLVKPSYFWNKDGAGDLRKWWTERQGRSLHELQIETLQWTIQKEENAGFIDEQQKAIILTPLLTRLEELSVKNTTD